MEPNEVFASPGNVLMLAIVVGLIGGILFLVGNLMLKAMGIDIDEYNRQTSYRRRMRPAEQLIDVYSNPSNIRRCSECLVS